MSDLKPCPFCGGNARIWQDPSTRTAWFIGCDDAEQDCLGSVHWAGTQAEAIAAWNARTVDPAAIREAALLADLAQGPMEGELMVPWIRRMMDRASAILDLLDKPAPDHSATPGNMIDKEGAEA